MNNKTNDIEVSIDTEQTTATLSKLLKILRQGNDIKLKHINSFWDVIEQLDQSSFSAMKTNVYFADVLRSIVIIQKETQDVAVNYSENRVQQIKNETNAIDSLLTQESANSILGDGLDNDAFSLPPLNTDLDMLDLPGKFMKLIKKLKTVSEGPAPFTLGENLRDLVSLPVHTIENLPSVGALYVHTFRELKKIANFSDEMVDGLTELNDKIDLSLVDTSDFRISLVGVDAKFIKPLEKFARIHNFDDMASRIDEVLSFKKDELLSLVGFGRTVVDALIEFRMLVENEIKAISVGELNYRNFESRLIVPKCINSLSLKQIELLLLDDIDSFLDCLSNDDLDITQRRWGYVEEKETLEDISKSYGLTRERIRQKTDTNNRIFLKFLRLNHSTIWELIEPELDHDFPKRWPALYSCFSSEKAFYEFLDTVCNQDNLYDYVYPEIDKSVFNTYFAENGVPIIMEDALEYLSALKLPNVRNHVNAVQYLTAQGVLSIKGEFIWPNLLGKSEASACVLVNYPKGLPWLDIAKLVNSNALSRSEIYEDRLDNEALKHPDYIYLAGKGVYKHTNFLNSEAINLDEIFFQLTKFIESSGREVFHLNECYSVSDVLKKVEYYEIRHFVKHFGEDYGFYFNGRSQSDSVGLNKGFKNITQKDVIIEAMNKRERPLTTAEVASLLISKSFGNASLYLDLLIEDGRVVQVDRMMYTTPDKAYHKVDVNMYLDALKDVLVKYGKPVEPSIFKVELNKRFVKSYSKYFYASIARLYSKRQGWQRKYGLYSINQISYKNLKDVIQSVCSLHASVNENIVALQEHVAITNETASVAIANWKCLPDVGIEHKV
jgi:hypothetical protein